MDRITTADINAALGRYVRAAEALGIQPPNGHHIEYHKGSKRYGNSFKLVWVDESSGGRKGAPGFASDGFMGWTTREAYAALQNVARAFEDAKHYGSQ